MLGYALVALCVVLVLLPPRWDPAIRLKERQRRRAHTGLPDGPMNVGGMSNVMALSLGVPSPYSVGDPITVCTVDGCMAEILTPRYVGKITRTLTKGRADVPLIEIQVSAATPGTAKTGELRTELVDRIRQLQDGRLIVAN